MNSKYFLQDEGLSIQIKNALLEKMNSLSTEHFPNEYGGLLIGFYTNNNQNLVITDLLLPKIFSASPTFFEREIGDMKYDLEKYFISNPSKYYVGEWHSHPDGDPFPSIRNKKAMRHICKSKNVSIQKPILCIIGYTKDEFQVRFHLIIDNKTYTYEKQHFNF